MDSKQITLIKGRKVSILFNMNALKAFRDATGLELTDLKQNDYSNLLTLAWITAMEGELAEGRTLGLNEEEFGRQMDMRAIIDFCRILVDQSSTSDQKKKRLSSPDPEDLLPVGEIDPEEIKRLSYSSLRKFALGILRMDPLQFDKCLVCDMLDAYLGQREWENDRIKSETMIIRTATTKLWNTQIVQSDRLTENELWPLPWDKKGIDQVSQVNNEEADRNAEAQAEFLRKNF